LPTAVKTVLIFGALLFASCSSIAERANSKLIGKWRSTDQRGHTAVYEFLANGTFRGSVTDHDGSLLSEFVGRWVFRDRTISYEYISDKTGRIRAGTKDRDKLLTIDRDHFVIEAADGSIRKYVRVING
jgi:hypothetical protein